MTELKNAIITSTTLGNEDHGIMTCSIYLDYGGSGQAFGGYCLDSPIKDKKGNFLRRSGTAYGMNFIMKILEVLEVSSWEKLKGAHCRVEASFDKVHRIGHFLKESWFDPKTLKEVDG